MQVDEMVALVTRVTLNAARVKNAQTELNEATNERAVLIWELRKMDTPWKKIAELTGLSQRHCVSVLDKYMVSEERLTIRQQEVDNYEAWKARTEGKSFNEALEDYLGQTKQ